ncbi:hypothetical protein F5Y06DRAFT_257075 [Hypoxylon sp. FL0890]|nr:hypothetical protein F5Y06DRAFT_257075 [Hypoxylon sp. FL0890]
MKRLVIKVGSFFCLLFLVLLCVECSASTLRSFQHRVLELFRLYGSPTIHTPGGVGGIQFSTSHNTLLCCLQQVARS